MIIPDEELHRHAENIAKADALLFGRVTYEMIESAWRAPAGTRARRLIGWNPEWNRSPARSTEQRSMSCRALWTRSIGNAELVRGDLATAVQQLDQQPGKGLFTGGVTLPLALAELGLIDEYEIIVHPRLVGHGPTLFSGLSKPLDLKLVSRLELSCGAVAMRYEPGM